MTIPDQRYSREEVDAILGRAVERQRNTDDLSREQLHAVAKEIGVSKEAIDRAIDEIAVERRERDELVVLRQKAWRGFIGHLIPYLCVNGLLVVINYFTTHFPWALFPILGWGIGLFSHLLAVAMPSRERLERQLQRTKDREQRQLLKRQLKAGAKELEVAVGQGVAALLQAAANRVQQSAESLDRDGSSRAPRRREPAPRVRVQDMGHGVGADQDEHVDPDVQRNARRERP